MNKITFPLIMIILSACALSKQSSQQFPAWWQLPEEGMISSYGQGMNKNESIAKLAAQNDAFHQFPDIIRSYLFKYVAENCIEPGDEVIQAELDNIFQRFTNYLMNLDQPQIILGNSSIEPGKVNSKNVLRYYVQLKMEQTYLHNAFVEFLATADFYIAPKLRSVLKECFS